jgi:HTH-type transcriptional regulator, competence development regulator
MAATAFGKVLKRLREAKGLSLRDVSKLSGVDHAYVYRLETGEKEAPSEDALTQIFRALKPTKRQESILRFISGRDVALDLVDPSIIDEEQLALEDFESAAQMSFRGKKPASPVEWRKLIDKIRAMREEIENG